MKTYILYHAGCWDGLAAAWVAKNHIITDNAVFIPVQYDQPLPDMEPNSTLYILDFCYPLEIMQNLFETPKYITVIDHHKTSANAIKLLIDQNNSGKFEFRFDISKSGCRLAWEFYLKDKPSPGIIDYIEDRDLWAWKLPGSKEVNACLRSYPMTFETLDKYSRLTYQQLYMEMFSSGEAILRREKQIVDTHVGFAAETKIAGYDILAANATVLISEIAGELAKGRPFGACYFREKSGRMV